VNILSAQGLAKAFGLRQLFSEVTLGVDERDRIALIGVNGSGKSTLLRILAGEEPPDEGMVATRQNLRVEYLPQNPAFPQANTVLECLFSEAREEAVLVREYESVCRALEKAPEDEGPRRQLENLTHRMDAAAAWGYETRAKTVLTQLGIQEFDVPIATLSGGFRKRVALAHTLLAEPDLLILDEPTNHLDADTIAWLEGALTAFSGAVLLVTHDRYFLDRVARRIIEIDSGIVRTFDGNYSVYLSRKADVEASAAAAEERRRAILRKEIAWLHQGAKARTTKQKARVQRIDDLAGQAPRKPREAILFAVQSPRLGKKVVELDQVSKSFDGRSIVRDFTFTFAPGERLGVVGPNGCGKTTLAQLILGRLEPESGTVTVGETVKFACFQQEYRDLDTSLRAIDFIKEEGGDVLRSPDGTFMTAETVMEKFLFTPQNQYTPIEKLSGGERRRLQLVATLMHDPNFLILDEPTNDLDIQTLQALEDFLDGFDGCLLVISHDRYFLDRTVDRLLSFDANGSLRTWPGNYSVYARLRKGEDARLRKEGSLHLQTGPSKKETGVSPAAARRPVKPTTASRRKITYKERKELENLESRIPEMEKSIKEIEAEMVSCASDYGKLTELTMKLDSINNALSDAFRRWEELAERAQED